MPLYMMPVDVGDFIDDDEESDDDQFGATDRSSSPVRSPPTQLARAVAPAASAPVRGNVPAPVPWGSAAVPRQPALSPSPPVRRKAMYNVGDINFEERTNKNRFLFTFTDPCDP